MLIAMENLAIVQYRDRLRYARIRSGAYKPQLQRFWVGDYVYLQRGAPTTLDIQADRTILHVQEILPSGVLLLKDKDGQECRDNTKNCAPCHLPIERSIHSVMAVVPLGFRCFFCGKTKGVATMLLCDQCQWGWHMTCLRFSLATLPAGDWSCLQCKKSG